METDEFKAKACTIKKKRKEKKVASRKTTNSTKEVDSVQKFVLSSILVRRLNIIRSFDKISTLRNEICHCLKRVITENDTDERFTALQYFARSRLQLVPPLYFTQPSRDHR